VRKIPDGAHLVIGLGCGIRYLKLSRAPKIKNALKTFEEHEYITQQPLYETVKTETKTSAS
jgi:hypothetical protein